MNDSRLIHSSEAEPHPALAECLRPYFCGRMITDVFFGTNSTVIVLDNGTVLDVGGWVMTLAPGAAEAA